MKEYIKAQTKTNNLVTNGNIDTIELDRFAHSDYRWADNRDKKFQHRQVLKGEIYQFEFGKNFIPEMSYEHRGMVLRINEKLLYVLPIFSYNASKYIDVYHPIDFPNSKSNLYLLKKDEYHFIKHDSVLKLNDLRTVSINRILYKQNDGRMNINSETFKEIEELVFQKYFPEFHYTYKKMEEEIERQEKVIRELHQEILKLQGE